MQWVLKAKLCCESELCAFKKVESKQKKWAREASLSQFQLRTLWKTPDFDSIIYGWKLYLRRPAASCAWPQKFTLSS